MIVRLIALLSLLALAAACAPDAAEEASEPAASPVSVPEVEPPVIETVVNSELAGTAWQLVRISSMDDSVNEPGDPAVYTLEFGADGNAAVGADCNRGTGGWTSIGPGQLQFGVMASTRAMCPPESMSDQYLAELQQVRSYVFENGNLYLATQADGSIIEFEPLITTPVAAVVLGEEIRTSDAGEMQQELLSRLIDKYAADNGIGALDSEIDAFIGKMQAGMAAEGLDAGEEDLTPEEQAQVAEMRREMGRAIIRQWKINKSLFEQYGGRIIYQQMGPEPLDAYRQYLEEQQQAGNFEILIDDFASQFWDYFTNESRHDFMESGGEDEAKAFSIPPWQQELGS